MNAAVEACRIDVWLFRARLVKSRGLAAALIDSGRLRLMRDGVQMRVEKPGREVRPGDEILFARNGTLVHLRIVSTGHRRGPASEAQALYEAVD